MAAPNKRLREISNGDENIALKKPALALLDTKLEDFLKWCSENDFRLTKKVKVCREGSCAQYGMLATEDIPEGYCLFQVPRTCVLMPENTEIANIFTKESENLSAKNQWVPLLISLLHEHSNSSSKWKPYLDLVPNYEELDLPMFWDSKDVRNLLKGTGVDLAVEKDQREITNDFNQLVLPFYESHPSLRSDNVKLEFFKKMVAFVMAYSFTEPEPQEEVSDDEDDEEEEKEVLQMPPMMVPMADMLNHVTDNNAKLTFGKEALKMVSTRLIKKGEEVFNTYGQVTNLHLLHMYGFSEQFPLNTNDAVEIPTSCMLEAAKALAEPQSESLLLQKWKLLENQEVVSEDEVFVLDNEGIITDDRCIAALKVICMNHEEFSEHEEKEGWSDAESESSLSGESRLTFEKIPELTDTWKQLLKKTTEVRLSHFPTSLAQDQPQMASTLSPRKRYALYNAIGQKELLHKLLNCLN